MTDRLLAIDVGTQSVRAILFDRQGEISAKAQIMIEPYHSVQPGWAEQDAGLYWDSIGQACQQLWRDADPRTVSGLALTTQRATSLCIGADDQPLRPAIVWLDQRHTDDLPPVGGWWGLAFRMLGVLPTISQFQSQAEANWIARHQPDIWQKTRRYVLLSGYLNFRLLGEWVDSIGSQVGYIPFDFKRRDWAADGDWRWQALPIRREQLPRLVPPGTPLGGLSADAARHLGLAVGTPVVAGAADKACEVLGAGCVQPDQACLSFGTTATINTTTPEYREVERFIPPYPAAVPGAYSTEIQIYRGFWMVSWFKRQFAEREQRLAQERGIAPEELLDELLATVPPGAMGLTLQPYWSPGTREPGPEAKGAIIGFGDVHTRAHVYRAILEGLAYALREGAEKTARRGHPINTLRVAGGGSQSRGAMQLTADIFGMPAQRPHVFETSALGAAINLAVGQGHYPDYPAAVAAMCRVRDEFLPDPAAQATYDALYRKVYKPMYRRLQPLYAQIREITGYPP